MRENRNSGNKKKYGNKKLKLYHAPELGEYITSFVLVYAYVIATMGKKAKDNDNGLDNISCFVFRSIICTECLFANRHRKFERKRRVIRLENLITKVIPFSL